MDSRLKSELNSLRELFLQTSKSAWGIENKSFKESTNSFEKECEIIRKYIPKTQKGEPHKGWQKSSNKLISEISVKNWREVATSGLFGKVISGARLFYGKEIHPEIIQALLEIEKEARDTLLYELDSRTVSCHNLLQLFEQHYASLLFEISALGFSDVKNLLFLSKINNSLQDLYYRIDRKISHLLFDEFQDTSRSEWLILEPIVEEIISKSAYDYSFFCVGDTKQAIYGWRGGVAEIFDNLEQRWRHLEIRTRESSYRSAKAVLEATNLLFGTLEENSALFSFWPEVASSWSKRFIAHSSAKPELSGYFSLATLEHLPEEGTEELSFGIQDAVFQTLELLMESKKNISIGILCRKNIFARELASALREAPYGVNLSDEGGALLNKNRFVSLLIHFLRLLEHPRDSLSAFVLANSAFSDKLKLKQPLNKQNREEISFYYRKKISISGLSKTISQLVLDFSCSLSNTDYLAYHSFLTAATHWGQIGRRAIR